jgi:hypothetical protein
MAKLPHADLVSCTAASAPRAGGILWPDTAGQHGRARPSSDSQLAPVMRKSAFRCRTSRDTVRARQRDGLSRGDHRPPDGGALSLGYSGGQAPYGRPHSGAMRVQPIRVRVLEQAAVAAEAVAPGRCQSPGSPIHPGRSASPEAAEVAAAEAEGAAEAAAERPGRSCRSGSP